jgi:hypothetical protein
MPEISTGQPFKAFPLFKNKESSMENSKLFDVYHGTNYPHRILQSVTLEQLQVYCKEHGMTHQAHRDTQRGVRYWDAFVIAA